MFIFILLYLNLSQCAQEHIIIHNLEYEYQVNHSLLMSIYPTMSYFVHSDDFNDSLGLKLKNYLTKNYLNKKLISGKTGKF